jgi:hypothetical protein
MKPSTHGDHDGRVVPVVPTKFRGRGGAVVRGSIVSEG